MADAKRNLVTVPLNKNNSFPHRIDGIFGAAKVGGLHRTVLHRMGGQWAQGPLRWPTAGGTHIRCPRGGIWHCCMWTGRAVAATRKDAARHTELPAAPLPLAGHAAASGGGYGCDCGRRCARRAGAGGR